MKVGRRVLLCAEVIAVGSIAMTRADAQVDVARRGSTFTAAEASDRSPELAHSSRLATDPRIDLDLHGVALKEVLRAIVDQSGIALLYNDDDLPEGRTVSVRLSETPVMQALVVVLRGTELGARATEAGIVIERRTYEAGREPREQQGSISGRVTDAGTGRGIDGANISVEGTQLRATTDEGGRFLIQEIPPGHYMITARRIGYELASRQVSVAEGRDIVVDIALTPATTVLNQVVVTGTVVPTEVKALPSPISVITSEQIAQQQHFTLPSIIRQLVPTAVAFANPDVPSSTRISVRGASSLAGSGNMKIFVDGIEATNSDFASIDPESIARIEIVRGPQAATIYGADAAGGVVQIFTKRGDSASNRPRFDVKAALGIVQTPYSNFDDVSRQRYVGTIRGGGEDVSYHFGGGFTSLGNYVPRSGEVGQSTRDVNGGVQLTRGIITADVAGRYHDDRAPVALNPLVMETGYTPASRPYHTQLGIVNETYGARLTMTPAGWWRNQFTAGVDRMTEHSVQTQPRLRTPADTLLSLFDYLSRKLSLGYNTTVMGAFSDALRGSVTLGIDHYTQTLVSISSQALDTSGTIRPPPSGSLNYSTNAVTNTGYFAQAQLSVRDALFVTGGVRAEDNSTFGAGFGIAVLPRVGLSFAADIGAATLKVRSSYGRALRSPSAGQASGRITATSIQEANPELAPEQQRGWDAGFDLVFGNRASLSATGYDQTAEDLIAFLQVGSTPLPTYQYRNIGRVSNRGIEVEAKLEISGEAQLSAQYGYVRSRIERVGSASTSGAVQPGDRPLGVPDHTAGAALTVTPARGTVLTAGLTYVGAFRQTDVLAEYRCLATLTADKCPASFLDTFSTRAFRITYPGFAKVNLAITHRFTPQLEAFISVDNLTDSDAYEGTNTAPVVGRSTMAGIHLSF